MSDLNEKYIYEVVVSYTIDGDNLENFVEEFKHKPDKYVISVQRIEKQLDVPCCPDSVIFDNPPCPICKSDDDSNKNQAGQN